MNKQKQYTMKTIKLFFTLTFILLSLNISADIGDDAIAFRKAGMSESLILQQFNDVKTQLTASEVLKIYNSKLFSENFTVILKNKITQNIRDEENLKRIDTTGGYSAAEFNAAANSLDKIKKDLKPNKDGNVLLNSIIKIDADGSITGLLPDKTDTTQKKGITAKASFSWGRENIWIPIIQMEAILYNPLTFRAYIIALVNGGDLKKTSASTDDKSSTKNQSKSNNTTTHTKSEK